MVPRSFIFYVNIMENILKLVKDFLYHQKKKKQNEDVLAISNGFRLWFDQKLVKTNNKRDYITLQHLSKEFKHSEFWKNKPKTQKRMGALAYLTSKIRNDKKMNYFYRKEKNSKATGRIYGGIYVSHILNNPIYDHHNNHNNNHSDNSNFLNMDVDDEESSENCEKNNINETNDSTKKKKKTNRKRRLNSKSESPINFEPTNKKRKISKKD